MASEDAALCGADEESERRLARWRGKWQSRTTSWHLDGTHPALATYLHGGLILAPGARVLLPLCGASDDLLGLAADGFDVVGVDGAPEARDAYVAARGATVEGDAVTLPDGTLLRYHVGDFFDAGAPAALGVFDGAFDRGGLVAVAPDLRPRYAARLAELVRGAMLLVAVEHGPFDGGKLGPPFSIPEAEARALFAGTFRVDLLKREDRLVAEPAWAERGCTEFFETTYLLTRLGPEDTRYAP